ncbi:MAG TPA: copper resistance protein CopC [Streptosporangiaceae bacterium]
MAKLARRFTRLAAAMVLAGLVLLTGTTAALAHATLERTSPAEGSIVRRAPTQVTATFDEPVGISSGSLKVFAPNGERVDTGGARHGSTPAEVVIALKSGLVNGTYTVGWAVVSADSHHVSGAFTFSIGAPSSTSVKESSVNQTGSPLVSFTFGVVRWIAFTSFALLIGAVSFVLWCWPAGASSQLVLRLTMGAWSGLAGSVLGGMLLQGAYGAGAGVSRVFWPNVLHATLYSRYGRSLGVRLILVVVALFAFSAILGNLRADGRRPPVTASIVWSGLAAALAATWAAADHAGTGMQVPLSLVSDTVHLCAVAIWLGGLTMLAAIVLRPARSPAARRAGKPASRKTRPATAAAVQAVERFSPLALTCVGAILVTGTYQAWRNVGSWPALFDTTYGRLLLIKIGAMLVLIFLGYLARMRISAMRAPAPALRVSVMQMMMAGLPRVGAGVRSGPASPGAGYHHGATSGSANGSSSGPAADGPPYGAAAYGGTKRADHWSGGAAANGSSSGSSADSGRTALTLSRLRWSVTAEALIASVVLAVTAVLVNSPTGRETFKPPVSAVAAFSTGGPGGRGNVRVTVTPAVLGPNQVRLSVTGSTGRPYTAQQVQAALLLPARHLGPLPIALKPDGAGHYASGSIAVPITGKWQLQITIRSDAFDEATVVVPVPVR